MWASWVRATSSVATNRPLAVLGRLRVTSPQYCITSMCFWRKGFRRQSRVIWPNAPGKPYLSITIL